MKILVCIKQVPEPEARIEPAPDGRSVQVAGEACRMNRYDACALECAVRLKAAATVPVTIHAVTVGPDGADVVLRRAMGMGADAAAHLVCTRDPFLSPYVVAEALAHYARKAAYDLILCGVVSEDMMQGITGPILAEHLGLPAACSVMTVRFWDDGAGVDIEKEVEGGVQVAMALPLPALLSIQSGVYQPRYPSLSRLLKAAGAVVETFPVQSEAAPRQRISHVGAPSAKVTARFLEGSLEQKARALQHLLAGQGVL
ncbi:MAG: hypothetical protein ABIL58_25955 [Pseudomonadota bacterium]